MRPRRPSADSPDPQRGLLRSRERRGYAAYVDSPDHTSTGRPSSITLAVAETGQRWQAHKPTGSDRYASAVSASLGRALSANGAVSFGPLGYWLRAEANGSVLSLGLGHRLCGRGCLAQLRVTRDVAASEDRPDVEVTIEGLLRAAELVGNVTDIVREIAGLGGGVATEWWTGEGAAVRKPPQHPRDVFVSLLPVRHQRRLFRVALEKSPDVLQGRVSL